jgi:hypothetical protein
MERGLLLVSVQTAKQTVRRWIDYAVRNGV